MKIFFCKYCDFMSHKVFVKKRPDKIPIFLHLQCFFLKNDCFQNCWKTSKYKLFAQKCII